MCLYPRLIQNRKYVKNKKNGGNIPPINDQRTTKVPVGCQRCIECRRQAARGWQLRLLEEIKTNKNGKFITLTFNTESLHKLEEDVNNYVLEGTKRVKRKRELKGYILDNEIAKRAMRLFNERYRKHHKKALRHWMITELGHTGTEHLHIHGIIWTDVEMDEIEKIWGYGWVWKGKEVNGKRINYVNAKTINYIVKYVHKMDVKHKHYKSMVLTSPGIGGKYTNSYDARQNRYKGEKTEQTYRTEQGYKIAMPAYWRNKIYSEEEREKLWINMLDKNERWIRGERIDINKNNNEYYELLKYYRRENKELGYGTDEKNWDQEEYERERRILIQTKRKQREYNNKKKEN